MEEEGPSKRSFGKREILILNVFLKHGIGVVSEERVKLKGNSFTVATGYLLSLSLKII